MVSIRGRRQSAGYADQNTYLGHVTNLTIKLGSQASLPPKADISVSQAEAPPKSFKGGVNVESQGTISTAANNSSKHYQTLTIQDRKIYSGHISSLTIKLDSSESFQPKADISISQAGVPQKKFEGGISLESQGNKTTAVNGSSKAYLKALAQDQAFKRNHHHKRKHIDNRIACTLRGVYYKNMKWQAAIKVGKKQVHLGTVGSQEEAAHLYDRAAYMCGRQPNFELSEEEQQELQSFQWEEFLALTRQEIANKKMQNKLEAQIRRKQAAGVKGSVL